jgi:hypothetical protein
VFTVGLTTKEAPLPIDVPPQLLVYHCQEAPVPNEPPETFNVVALPGHEIGFTVADAPVGFVD